MASEIIQLKGRVTNIEKALEEDHPTTLDVFKMLEPINTKLERIGVMLEPLANMHQTWLRSQGAQDAQDAKINRIGKIVAIGGGAITILAALYAILRYIATH